MMSGMSRLGGMSKRPSFFDPEQFLELANKLVNDSEYDTESRARTVIGRAYYASFLATQNKLQKLGIRLDTQEKIHDSVITSVKEKNQFVGDLLSELRDLRVDADYFPEKKITLQIGHKCTKLARQVLNRLPHLSQL